MKKERATEAAPEAVVKVHKNINATYTQRKSFAETVIIRSTEADRLRALFLSNPETSFSRSQLCDLLGLPINHITRATYNLIGIGFLKVTGRGKNPLTGKTVELVGLSKTDEL